MVLGRQTRSTIHFAVMAGLLLTCLALAEFPELLQLRDDTSNDFTVSAAMREALSAPSTAKSVAKTSAMFAQHGQPALPALAVFSSSDFATQSSVEYLHLLCVHRT